MKAPTCPRIGFNQEYPGLPVETTADPAAKSAALSGKIKRYGMSRKSAANPLSSIPENQKIHNPIRSLGHLLLYGKEYVVDKRRFVRLMVVKNLLQAELIQSLLKTCNIPCEIRDRGQAEVFDGAAPAITGGMILRVPEHHLLRAQEVLGAARDAGKLLDEEAAE